MSGAPRLELRAASRRWGSQVALRPTDLVIEPGERVAVLGPSGAGKSTLLRLLVGALSPSGGQVVVGDRELGASGRREVRDHRRRCAYMTQAGALVEPLSAHDNVVAGLVASWPWYRVIASRLWPLERARVAGVLGELEIESRQWDRVSELSGGQRQRVALARAMVAERPVIALDEPTGALDPETARAALERVNQRADRRRATVIVATHRVSEAIEVASRVIGLRDGAVELDCPSAEVSDAEIDAIYRGSDERT